MSLENPNLESEADLQNAYTIFDNKMEKENEKVDENENEKVNAKDGFRMDQKPPSVMDELRSAISSGDQERINTAQAAADQKYSIHKVKNWTSHAADFVPVVGSAKMVYEAVKGEQIGTGKSISGWQRAAHGVTGAAFLAADLTGVGALGSIAGKAIARGGIKIGEHVIEQSAEKVAERIAVEQIERSALAEAAKLEAAKLAARGDQRIQKSEQI